MSQPRPPNPPGHSPDSGATADFPTPGGTPAQHTPSGEAPTQAPVDVPQAPVSLIGRIVGDFEILSELGRGGMGVVYKARQLSLDRIVAVKMLLADHSQYHTLLARFLTEARAVAALFHPNIIHILQVGDSPVGRYFAMEYIDGVTLETVLARRTLSVASAIGLLIPVSDAIAYAHGKGIVHRDLKPANIMIDQLRRPVVMDFGIAKVLGNQSTLTQQGVPMGTPAYMSPEQAGEATGEVGPATDVYALGAILYRVLTGRLPYDGPSALRVILKVISPEMPPPPRSLRPEVPVELERLCLRCLAKQPQHRYPSAQALADELRKVKTQVQNELSGRHKLATGPAIVLVARKTGTPVRLAQPTVILGRAADCDVVVKVSDVSKHHCRIVHKQGQFVVEDLDSVNGTFLNGRQIRRAVLADGDELALVDHVFKVHLEKEAPRR